MSKKIAIGGMIGSGKSTLVKGLSKALNWQHMEEYQEKDPVFNTLLKWLYEGVDDVEMLLQVYFLHTHWKNQKNYTGDVVIDRDVIEHWLFAQKNLKSKTEVLNMYNGLFHAYMNSHKLPDLYVILEMGWATFKDRIRKRGRPQEIENFDKNASYFIDLMNDYEDKLIAQCILYDIPYVVIGVDGKSKKEVLEETLSVIEDLGYKKEGDK